MQAANRLTLPLARVPLFRGLDDATIDDILSCMQARRYAAGELICRQGEPSDSLFLLRSGVAKAFVLRGSSATTIARLRPGDVIGEVGVVTNLPRSASVIARSDVTVFQLGRDDVASLLARHPRLLANITQVIGGRLAKMNADLRGFPSAEVVALIVGTRFARAGTNAISAARLASPHPVAAVDLLQKRRDGTESGSSLIETDAPSSLLKAIERLEDLCASHATVVIAVTPEEEGITHLLEHADRVVAILADDQPAQLADMLRATSHDAELVLVSDETGSVPTLPDGYRIVRRCAVDLTGKDVAWLGRHLSRTKLGLSLGAGGFKCFAHAGVIKVLEGAGYSIDCVAGSSMGAVVAVWLALGMTASEIEARLRDHCGSDAVVNSIFRKGAAGDGIEVFARIFRETTADRSFADLAIPATVMTADLAGKRPAPIRTGPLWEALMAALTVPGLYTPWARGEQRLVDAVSLTPVPLDSVIEMGADVTIAVNLLGRETLPEWPFDCGSLAIPNFTRGQARDTVIEVLELAQLDASARQTSRADVPITPVFGPGTWRHAQLGSLFFAAGKKAAEAQLPLLSTLARLIS
ncbi:MAG TPA: cyclic nucleotide-binding domain-containing protein [Candidatus Binatia bacterium]